MMEHTIMMILQRFRQYKKKAYKRLTTLPRLRYKSNVSELACLIHFHL